jgi:hypothetical protein
MLEHYNERRGCTGQTCKLDSLVAQGLRACLLHRSSLHPRPLLNDYTNLELLLLRRLLTPIIRSQYSLLPFSSPIQLVSLGFSPVQARRALQATHVDGVPESPWVEQAANWLLENDLNDHPPKPKSPVRPSFGARMASEQRETSHAGRFDHLFEDEAHPGETTGVQNHRPGGVQSGARVPGRPPAVPVHRPPIANGAGPSGAGPSGTARAPNEGEQFQQWPLCLPY